MEIICALDKGLRQKVYGDWNIIERVKKDSYFWFPGVFYILKLS